MIQYTTSPHLSAHKSTTSSLNCIIILENRSFFFLNFLFFFAMQPGVLACGLPLPRPLRFFDPLFCIYFTTRWSQSVNIKTERVALLQPCGSMETINSVVILSMRFCQLATAMLLFFIYIFQTGFIYKTKIYHWSCRERTIHITWNAMSNTATESLVAHSLNRNWEWLRWRRMYQRLALIVSAFHDLFRPCLCLSKPLCVRPLLLVLCQH